MAEPGSPATTWGASATAQQEFRWPAWSGGEVSEWSFRTVDEAVEPFGLLHNDVIRFGAGPWQGRKARVLGVSVGCVWVQLAGETAVRDLKFCASAEEIRNMYGPVQVDADESFGLPPTVDAADAPSPPSSFVVGTDLEQLAHYEYPTTQGMYRFEATPSACEPFGHYHGQHLRATVGAEAGKHCVVIGVHSGVLWVHWYQDRCASPCLYCSGSQDIVLKYGFHETRPAPQIEEERPTAGKQTFTYPAAFGIDREFDRGAAVHERFGVRHGQRLRLMRGMSRGRHAVVIGISAGSLWMHIEGDQAATCCHHCSGYDELKKRFKYVEVDEVEVQPGKPFYHASTSAAQRERQVEQIKSIEIESWNESHQPQTYRFLRAYARWRLPKGMPKGQSFMLYYVEDTAKRTAEALENLGILHRFWTMQQGRGLREYGKSFSEATEKEMFTALTKVPLQALTILSARPGGPVSPMAASQLSPMSPASPRSPFSLRSAKSDGAQAAD
eukprot:TRINITY_DN15425_c0_g1_i1.p1 TRINITY_DN15425_c0_g1~~TRINITY_DN15425_c0_g1_i1.p1  ORF type:complete len:514 (+),score=156.17 TRINITY_DN15425_c0_g1_i1:48-1544(+)